MRNKCYFRDDLRSVSRRLLYYLLYVDNLTLSRIICSRDPRRPYSSLAQVYSGPAQVCSGVLRSAYACSPESSSFNELPKILYILSAKRKIINWTNDILKSARNSDLHVGRYPLVQMKDVRCVMAWTRRVSEQRLFLFDAKRS